MNTNTFYKPKNEFGELLASIPQVTKITDEVRSELTNAIVSEKLARETEDNNIHAILTTTQERLDAYDKDIVSKIANSNTIKVKWINADRGDNKCSNIDEYFRSIFDKNSIFYKDPEEVKIELGQTIYIIEGKDDSGGNNDLHKKHTYEEWVCLYPDLSITEDGLPVMIRLGAVDSILARHNTTGSVKLVHDLYGENIEWNKYFELDYNGNIKVNEPIRGEAVAPIALKAFYDADQEIQQALALETVSRTNEDNAIRNELTDVVSNISDTFNNADAILSERISTIEKELSDFRLERIENSIESLTTDYIASDQALSGRIDGIEAGNSIIVNDINAHGTRLDDIENELSVITSNYNDADLELSNRIATIEKELDGSEIENNVGIHGSRLDRIEAAIGINGCCVNCGKADCSCRKDDNCECSDTDNMCTIYCRLHDIEGDIAENNEQLINNEERISINEDNINELTERISQDESNITDINEKYSNLDTQVGTNTADIVEIKINIDDIRDALELECSRAENKDEEHEQKLSNIFGQLENLDEKTGSNLNEISEINCTITAHDSRILAADSRVSVVETLLANTDTRVSEVIDNVTDLNTELSDIAQGMVSQYNEFTTKIGEVYKDITENTEAINDLSSDITSINEHLDVISSEVNTRCNAIEEDLGTLNEQCTSFSEFIGESSENISAIGEDVANAKSNIDAHLERILKNEEAISNINDIIGDIDSNNIETLWGVYNKLSKELDDILSNVNGDSQSLNEKIETLRTLINSVESGILAIIGSNTDSPEGTTIRANLNAFSRTLNSYNERIEAIESLSFNEKIETLRALINGVESNILAIIGSNTDSPEGTTIHANLNAFSRTLNSYDERIEAIENLSNSSSELDNFKAEVRNSIDIIKNKVDDLYEAVNSKVDTTIQFVVRTTLENGVKEIKVPVLFDDKGSGSSEWGRVQVNSVVAVIGDSEQCIYPEIIYTGSSDGEGKDTRQITITFGTENIETYITFSAFKHNKATIKTI